MAKALWPTPMTTSRRGFATHSGSHGSPGGRPRKTEPASDSAPGQAPPSEGAPAATSSTPASGAPDPLAPIRELRAEGQFEQALSQVDLMVRASPHDALAREQRGLVLLELRRASEALSELDQALSLRSDLAAAHAARGDALRVLGDKERALWAYAKALQLVPGSEAWRKARRETAAEFMGMDPNLDSHTLAMEAMRRGQRGLAVELSEEALSNGETDPEAWREDARQLKQEKLYDDLLTRARARLARFSGDPVAQAYLGYALFGKEDWKGCLEPLTAAERDPKERREVTLCRARALYRLKREEEATPLVDALLAEAVDDMDLLRMALSSPWARQRPFPALKGAHRLVLKFPKDPETWRALVVASFRVGHYAETAEAAGKVRALDPKQVGVALPQAIALARLGHLDHAAQLLEDYLKEDPEHPEAWRELGLILHRQKKLPEAEAALKKAVELDPDHVGARMALATLLSKLSKDEQAESEFLDVTRRDPKNVEAFYDLGVVRQKLEKDALAAEAFQAALARDRSHVNAASNLAVVLAKGKRYDEAAKELEATLAFRPDAKDLNFNLGQVYLLQGRSDEAYLQFKRAHRLDPFDYESWNHRGAALSKMHRIDERSAEGWMALGRGFLRRQGFSEAHECFRRALELDPQNEEAKRLRAESLSSVYGVAPTATEEWLQTSRMLVEMHQFADALDALSVVLMLEPEQPQARVLTGRALLSLGKAQVAVHQADLAIRSEKDNSGAWALKGEALLELQKPADALVCFDWLLEHGSKDPAVHTFRGVALAALGRGEDAVKAFDDALKRDPHFREAWHHKGVELEKEGHYERAAEAFTKGFS